MGTKKYDVKKVSRETLELAAQEIVNAFNSGASCVTFDLLAARMVLGGGFVKDILDQSEVPLRTKAEVDADISKCVRSYKEQHIHVRHNIWNMDFSGHYTSPLSGAHCRIIDDLNYLLKEETSD